MNGRGGLPEQPRRSLTMTPIRAALGMLPMLVGSALAQAPQPAAPVRPALAAAAPCSTERSLAAAEATTPGILQRLTGETLERCLADLAQPARQQQGMGR
jgi:hypothetical protein